MKKPSHSFSSTRAKALIKKEALQMIRDKSTLTLGIILPIILLILFGYGLSLDVKLVPVTLVQEDSSPLTRDLYTHLAISPYFEPKLVYSWQEAEYLLRNAQTNAIIRRSPKDSVAGNENVQIIVNGRDSNTSRIMMLYLESAITQWAYTQIGKNAFSVKASSLSGQSIGQAIIEGRIWYNTEIESRYFLIPGVTALIMTLVGSLLTALVIAREWERGTYEALISTPVRAEEIILGKTIPYFILGLCALSMCLCAAAWLFNVPMRGSNILIILCSALYLLISLSIGLVISATLKSQFLASQIVLIISFLPVVMLSGFIFDLNSAPTIAYYIAHIFPSTWYISLLQTLFLAGDVHYIVFRDMSVLLLYLFILFNLTKIKIKKSLE